MKVDVEQASRTGLLDLIKQLLARVQVLGDHVQEQEAEDEWLRAGGDSRPHGSKLTAPRRIKGGAHAACGGWSPQKLTDLKRVSRKDGGAGGRTRTDMRSEPRQILSLVRIPISPLRQEEPK